MTSILKLTLLINLPHLFAADDFYLFQVCGSIDLPRQLFEVRGVLGIIPPFGLWEFFIRICFVPKAVVSIIDKILHNVNIYTTTNFTVP